MYLADEAEMWPILLIPGKLRINSGKSHHTIIVSVTPNRIVKHFNVIEYIR